MISLSTLFLFSLAALALTTMPGPDMLLIASRSIAQGRRAGFATLAGIQVGTYCHVLAASVGLAKLLLILPLAYDLIRYAGAAYLLYLAWQLIRSRQKSSTPTAKDINFSMFSSFKQGLITNLLNPKMALFVLALFPQFVDPQAGSITLQMLLLASLLNVIGLLVNGIVIISAAYFAQRLGQKSRSMVFQKYLLASVFVGLAFRLIAMEKNV